MTAPSRLNTKPLEPSPPPPPPPSTPHVHHLCLPQRVVSVVQDTLPTPQVFEENISSGSPAQRVHPIRVCTRPSLEAAPTTDTATCGCAASKAVRLRESLAAITTLR